jgi:hypothetical protein
VATCKKLALKRKMSDPPYNLPPITTSLPAIKTDSKNSPQEAAMNQGYSM